MTGPSALVPYDGIEQRIVIIRGQRVMLDADLAALYGVETRVLIQAMKRDAERFPGDFVFQLTAEERAGLRSQIVISKKGRGGRRYTPYAFTEHENNWGHPLVGPCQQIVFHPSGFSF